MGLSASRLLMLLLARQKNKNKKTNSPPPPLLHCTNPGDLIDAVGVPSAPRQDYAAHWAKKSSSIAD